jgi:hypothetical protein
MTSSPAFRTLIFSELYLDGNNNLYGLNSSGQTSSNAYQKSPPQQSSGDGFFLWTGKYNLTQPGPGGVNLRSPIPENLTRTVRR